MFSKQTIRDIKIKGHTVLLRTDYNVPLKDGKVTSDLRIRASLPTIQYLLDQGAKKVIIISHLGRPEGIKNKSLSLQPVADVLAQLLPERRVDFVDDVSGPDVEEAVMNLPRGGILLLENLRFYRGEEANSSDFAREVVESTHADIFVQDGFAVIHRAHASTVAITSEIPSVAGLLVEKEVSELTKVIESPAHPFYALIGGSKVEDKQPLIDKLLKVADEIWVGGKIAADGYTPNNPKIHVATEFKTDATGAKLDISDQAAQAFADSITKNAKTILWNGVLGKVEDAEFATASTIVARAIGQKKGLTSVICGGDTAGFAENLQATETDLNYTLISTGGGASLELLSGLTLPGLEALDDK